ncbi:hypothetical protein, partial [Candidatus Cardinium hertigii]|uniref:hypothetical protein n=1 Tax=Candidatus Cardinium hertigii TaxID=247481 RepID=UPI001C866660
MYRSYVDQFSILTELHGWTDVTDQHHFRAATEALAYNQTIKNIYLSYNNIGFEGAFEGAKALAQTLEKNSTIRTIFLGSNDIGSDGAKVLAKALEKNSTITEINL